LRKPVDQRNKLAEEIFSFKTNKEGKVFIYWQDHMVLVLKEDKAKKFLKQIKGLDLLETQLVMAKITGNFKRGNERNTAKGEN
jgi:hypothetical protein